MRIGKAVNGKLFQIVIAFTIELFLFFLCCATVATEAAAVGMQFFLFSVRTTTIANKTCEPLFSSQQLNYDYSHFACRKRMKKPKTILFFFLFSSKQIHAKQKTC